MFTVTYFSNACRNMSVISLKVGPVILVSNVLFGPPEGSGFPWDIGDNAVDLPRQPGQTKLERQPNYKEREKN